MNLLGLRKPEECQMTEEYIWDDGKVSGKNR